ncbi:uncharacterized protein H6S33_007978 [Morchella sextelata]|uniref:uncharacterized protein n=1 Tax=Morchella sextelata TaxID=1174677 RepID=UPI001D039138|nr:uncharacterized protein H6S33_007978 [Morchella sextelata]KAH0602974.1 hypothetical protein H6S33_007978 [Morchella sextelata]
MPSQNPTLDIHHPTDFPIRQFILRSRLAAIEKATTAHKLIREKLLTLKTECKDGLTENFLDALERELNRVNRVLGDFSIEFVKVGAEINVLESAEARRVCVQGKEVRRRCF